MRCWVAIQRKITEAQKQNTQNRVLLDIETIKYAQNSNIVRAACLKLQRNNVGRCGRCRQKSSWTIV
jgi:hypothetical protein